MHHFSIAQLSAGLHNKTFSSVELTQFFLDRIQKFDGQLNSFITVTPDLALQAAKEADERLKRGDATTLTGIPFAHKDIFCTKGIKTSCGSKMLDNFVAPYDATVTHQLQQSGAIMLGKTNMDEFAMGSSNENSFYGPVKNPWDTTRVPGGSSGGSAAAIAARLSAFSTGTDTGGSIRQPASLCGITGLKPTYGRVSRYGMIAFASSLDQAGIFAASAEDIAHTLPHISGFDEKDSTSSSLPVTDYVSGLNQSIKGLKIGLPKEFFSADLDESIGRLVQDASTKLQELGAELVEISLPNMELSIPCYYIIAPAECSSNLARYDGVRFGYRCEDPKDLMDLYKRSRAEAFGAEVQRRIMVGTYVLSTGYFDAYYRQAQRVRRLIRDDFTKAFEKVDVILAPTSPCTAFKIGEKSTDPVSMYLADIYTIAVNLAGLPGLSMPAGFSEGLPVGVQLIGKDFEEARLLNVAHQYQTQTDWHQQRPAQFS